MSEMHWTGSERLAEVLLAHRDRSLAGDEGGRDDWMGWRFVDAPPDLVATALELLGQWAKVGRPNDQPPAAWLVEQARRLDGRLGGFVAPAREMLRVDAIAVPRAAAVALAQAVAQDWPATPEASAALDLAVAESWSDWDAETSAWTGTGAEVLSGGHGPGAVVGLWWD